MFKRIISFVLCMALVLGMFALPVSAANNGAISSLVDSYSAGSGSFQLTTAARLYVVSDKAPSGKLLETLQVAAANFLAAGKPGGLTMPITYGAESAAKSGDILIKAESGLGDEGYKIQVTTSNITVYYSTGSYDSYYGDSSYNGLHYGLQTVLKSFITNGSNSIDCCTMTDAPDTKERVLQLDCARKYWSMEWIENLIREMSWMGYNALELHMTEDQGIHMNIWSEGTDSNGNDFSWICGYEAASWASSYPDSNGGNNYTAAQIRQIVALAKQYHIEIIPAVDFPGHCEYLISRYTSSGACNWFTFNYNGRNYSNRPSNIYYYNSGYSNSTSGNWGTIDITNDYAKNMTLAIIDAYADFFGALGCRKMDIGADEIRGTLDYSTFVSYINEVCGLLKSQGYSVRAFNDYLYGSSSVALDADLDIKYWQESSNASAQTYLNDGRAVYNCLNNYCYYVLRYNSSGGDARDQNNYWWSFHHSTEDRIYNEWNPSRMYAYNASSPTITNVAGAYFLIWGDWAGWNTESQVWNGTDGNRTYNLIDRMWSNSVKMWNWDINNSFSYSSYSSYVNTVRHYPGFTSCSAAPSVVSGAAVIPSGVYTLDNLADQSFRVDVEDASNSSGANVHVWEKNNNDSQKWIFWYVGNGYYTIQNMNSGHYLDVPYGKTDIGTNLWQCAYNGGNAQQWYLKNNGDGSYSLISRCNGLALDMNGGGQPKNGTNIQCYTSNGTTAQKWVLTPQAVLQDGVYTIANSADTNYRLDVYAASKENGVNIHIWTAHTGDSQKFTIKSAGNGYYTITNVNSGKVLDVSELGTSDGTNIMQYESNGGDNQKWAIVPYGGYYVLVSKCNGLALDMNGGGQPADGTNIQCWTLNLSTAQKWTLTSVHEHTYEEKVTPPTCTEQGYTTHTCSGCGDSYVDTYVAATGHNYTSETITGSCENIGYILYTCKNCGDTYYEYLDATWSDWSAEEPSGVAEDMLETRTVYRYRDKETTLSYETALDTYEQAGSSWVMSENGAVEYVNSWPSGFDTSNSLYSTYHRSAPTASETETAKTTVGSASIVGYIYWHWCTNNNYWDGPFNRYISDTRDATYTGFHAFYSTTNPGSLSSVDDCYQYSNGDCCKDSYWYMAIPVYSQSYTNYNKQYTYEKWGNWSEWSETPYTESATRQVESRTEYRYITNAATGEHLWDNGVVTKASNCTEPGVMTYTCEICNATKTEEIPATGHTEVKDPAKAATCTQDGLTEGSHCEVCGAVLVKQEVVPASHKPVTDPAVPATCTTTGLTEGSHCEVCGLVLVAQKEVPITHLPVADPAVTPTCTKTGLTEGSHCSICGVVLVKQETVPMVEHTPVTDPAVAATCTTTGLTEGSHCAVCGKVLVEQKATPTAEHTPTVDKAVAPTCIATGLTEGSHCKVCGEILVAQKTVETIAHVPVSDHAVAPTCTTTGLTAGTHCDFCGRVLTEQKVVDKIDHTPVTDKAVAATCTATGLTEGSHCKVCGTVLVAQETVAKLAHTPVTDPAVAPTSSSTGLTEGSHCGVCGTVLVAQQTVAKLAPPVNYSNLPSGVYTIANAADTNYQLDVDSRSTSSGANVHIWSAHTANSQKWIIWSMGNGYYTIENLNSGKYLDVWGQVTTDGTNIWQYDYNGGVAQLWRIVDNGDNTCTFVSACGDKVLDMNGGGQPANGTNIQIWTNNGSSAQKWVLKPQAVLQDGVYTIGNSADSKYLVDVSGQAVGNCANVNVWESFNVNSQKFAIQADADGYYTIRAAHSGKLLDVAGLGTSNGTNIMQHEANGGDNQKWLVIPYNGNYIFVSKCNGLVLDMSGGGQPANGTNIQCWSLNWSTAQQWKLSPATVGMSGVYTISTAVNSDYVLNIQGDTTAQSANLAIYTATGADSQKFVIQAFEDGYYGIRSLKSGMYLNISGGSAYSGANVIQWGTAAKPGDNEKWSLVPNGDGTYSFISKLGGYYLDLTDGKTANETNVRILDGNGATAQKWILKPVDNVLADGTYSMCSAANSNYCLDVDAGSSNAQVWSNANSANQKFTLTYVGNGYYKIAASHSGKVLDVDGGKTAVGTNVWQYSYNGTDAQLWAALPNRDGSYTFVSKLGDFSLDMNGGVASNGVNVSIWSINGTAAQSWILK